MLNCFIRLQDSAFLVKNWSCDGTQHEWGGQTTYAELIESSFAHHHNGHASSLHFQFVSPTAFRTEGNDMPLPVPTYLFRSLHERWNAFAPIQIFDEWTFFPKDCLVISYHRLHTAKIKFAEGKRGAVTGFLGDVSFSILPCKTSEKWAGGWEHCVHILNTLSAFAFYSGVGHHTTVGLGQCRSVIQHRNFEMENTAERSEVPSNSQNQCE